MKELAIDGKKYVKASAIAKDLGYTSDYVGQLCRGGKIDAQLVGRSWYVDRDSIQAYKKSRYRSNQAKSKASVQAYQAARKDVTATRARTAEMTRHVPVHHYETDEADLLPAVQKEKQTAPAAADPTTTDHEQEKPAAAPEKKVPLKSKSSQRTFKPADKTEVKFTGRLPIANSETTATEPEVDEAPAPQPVKKAEPVSRKKRLGNPVRKHSAPEQEQSIQVHKSANNQRRTSGHSGWPAYTAKATAFVLVAVILVVVALSVEVVYVYQEGAISQSWSIDLAILFDYINSYMDISRYR